MTKKKEGAKMGRPRKEVDSKKVEQLARLQCTLEEIASALGISDETLLARRKEDPSITDAIERGRAEGKTSLRRLQYASAKKGSVPMQKWLGTQWLGQKDKADIDTTVTERKQIVIHRGEEKEEVECP